MLQLWCHYVTVSIWLIALHFQSWKLSDRRSFCWLVSKTDTRWCHCSSVFHCSCLCEAYSCGSCRVICVTNEVEWRMFASFSGKTWQLVIVCFKSYKVFPTLITSVDHSCAKVVISRILSFPLLFWQQHLLKHFCLLLWFRKAETLMEEVGTHYKLTER